LRSAAVTWKGKVAGQTESTDGKKKGGTPGNGVWRIESKEFGTRPDVRFRGRGRGYCYAGGGNSKEEGESILFRHLQEVIRARNLKEGKSRIMGMQA